METPATIDQQTQEEAPENACINCHIPDFEEGYEVKLCSSCRNQLVSLRIPLWIRIFSGIVIVLVLLGLVRMPSQVQSVIHKEKGDKAFEARKFWTAAKEYEQVATDYPDNVEINSKRLIAYFHNDQLLKMNELWKKLETKEADAQLYQQFQHLFSLQLLLNPDTTFANALQRKDTLESIQYLQDELKKKQEDKTLLHYYLADKYFDVKKFHEADSLLQIILKDYPDLQPALFLSASVYRETKAYDKSIAEVNKVLEINQENLTAIGYMARIELKRGNDQQAEEWIKKGEALDNKNIYILESRGLYCYLKGDKPGSIKVWNQLKSDFSNPGAAFIAERLGNVINGNTIYR
jgi:tetratricopeptide (TPR) repeat protein